MVNSAHSKRVIVSVGFGERYAPYFRRFKRTVAEHWDGPTLFFDDYPPNSPTHHAQHYGFKQFAILEALRQGYTSILYSDACVMSLKDPTPCFEEIEKEGYLLVKDGRSLRTWASDQVLAFADLDRYELGDNDTLAGGGFLGFDLNHVEGQLLWKDWQEARELGLNQVYSREHSKPENRGKSVAMWFDVHLSDDPSVEGSFGEEAVLGALCSKYGWARNTGPWCVDRNWIDAGGIFLATGYDEGTLGALT